MQCLSCLFLKLEDAMYYLTFNVFLQMYKERRPLKIGYYKYNGFFKAVPSMERAVQITKEKLQSKGHTVGLQKIMINYSNNLILFVFVISPIYGHTAEK